MIWIYPKGLGQGEKPEAQAFRLTKGHCEKVNCWIHPEVAGGSAIFQEFHAWSERYNLS